MISANTLDVEPYTEGSTLAPGKITFQKKSANVLTYAGAAALTIREAERSSVAVLNTTITGLTLAAAAREKAVLRSTFASAVAAAPTDVALGATLGASTFSDWTDAVVNAAEVFESVALPLGTLVVSKDVFLKLKNFNDTTGRPLMDVTGTGSNTIGTLNLPGLSGNLSGVTVIADTGATDGTAAFAASTSITRYLSGLVQLSNTSVFDLSQQLAVYRYGVPVVTQPEGIVPVTISAS
ncbi:hypothetical protein GCM10022286_05590 [Gryllotalpicola daejeonensis]|uniref:Phage major capsid protein n=1 Tax=Gryllotalpicola daejeonensis TaxID=993087 RepID=A0ABP7ZII9_9MICO